MKTLALALALATTVASAQTPPAPSAAPAPAPLRQGTIHIEGVVPRPYYWVQSRSLLHYQPAAPRRAFAPSVVRAVRDAPF